MRKKYIKKRYFVFKREEVRKMKGILRLPYDIGSIALLMVAITYSTLLYPVFRIWYGKNYRFN